MKYRWGFDVAGVFTECKPIIEDSTSLDYSQQSGEVFYRAKLNGTLSFRFEFDSLIAAGYNVEHQIILQYFDENTNDWAECWRGRFTLTDCEIDFDTNTISVQPETLDRYTAVLDYWESEYNLTKLAVQQQKVNIKIRPCVQLYALNDSKITNIVGHNTWEASCDSVGSADIDTYKFKAIGEYFAFNIKFSSYSTVAAVAGQTIVFSGVPDYSGNPRVFDVTGTYWTGSAYATMTLRCQITQYPDETAFSIYWPSGLGWEGTPFVSARFASNEAGTDAEIYIRDEGESNAYAVDANAQWMKLYTRTLVQTESSYIFLYGVGWPTYDIPDSDIAAANMNYNKIIQETATKNVFSGEVSGEPTEWGLNYNDLYYVKPADTPQYHYFPVAQTQWKYFSWWAAEEYKNGQKISDELERKAAAERTIKDGYKLAFVVLGLLQKNGWTGAGWISRVLGGSGDNFVDSILPVITPKSNVISSYYDTPAQNAPINLQKIFSMLKQAYKIYWHIDANGYIHVEHISYYENGGNYDETAPQLLVDLESRIHTNTKENKVFGQNKIKFEKSEMPQQFSFAWMDSQTHPFDGWAINCLDNYVQKGVKDEKTIAFFSTDVDFCLLSPSDMSRDGFFLFALPLVGGSYPNALQVERIRIKDDAGDTYEVTIQNADAAFCKIHESYWKYELPCENINVNNEDTTAKSTGKYKLQTVEFADTVLADILADVDNCNKVVRTQQGDGKIKTLSINLNSLAAKADLLFNFVGRFYYLRGTAIGASITILINGESTTINVANNKWNYRYNEPLTALNFNGADVVSVNLADCDRLESITTADNMFKNCAELLAVDFGGKKLAAVTSATDMFAGCAQLTTLICPQTSTWKPDLSFADCPDLTTDSIYLLLGYLYSYNSGIHTIDFNSTMWNALDADTQTDITTKAGAKGWTIGTATVYYISGQSAASTVYATINGLAVEIPVAGGVFTYAYNTPITSFSFASDTNLQTIDFTLSDGLAGVTSMAASFSGCSSLVSVNFTGCDLSALANAASIFSGCTNLTTITADSGVWQPDLDLSDSAMVYSDMVATIGILYTYNSGTHTITFNQTTWDALSVAQQQTIFDAAQLKYWNTNAVAVIYYIRGKSTAASETFTITFIDLGTMSTASETITCAVDGSGNFEYQYQDKKIYSLANTFANKTTITAIELAEDLAELTDASGAFDGCTNLAAISTTGVWGVDVSLLKSPITAASIIAFANQLADYSGGAQHTMRIGYKTAALLTDAQLTAMVAATAIKNWNIPLSQQGKLTRSELATLIDGGYVPIASENDWRNTNIAASATMGIDTEFEGAYYCDTTSNYVLVKEFSFSGVYKRNFDAEFNGNNLLISAKNIDIVSGGWFNNVGATAHIENVYLLGRLYPHNGLGCFLDTNSGLVENCIIDLIDSSGAVSQIAGLCRVNNGTIRRIQCRNINGETYASTTYEIYKIMRENIGTLEDIAIIGTYCGANVSNRENSAFLYRNQSTGNVTRVFNNTNCKYNSNGITFNNNGIVTDCLQNSTRLLNRGAGTKKTTTELQADAIGSGIYANYSADIWTKDNDGFPILKIAQGYEWNTDYTFINNYGALLLMANYLETQTTTKTATISATLWASLTAEEQATINGIVNGKNWNLATA